MYYIRLEGEGDNRSGEFVPYLMANRIIQEAIPRHTYQSNKFAEIIIRDLRNMVRKILFVSNLIHEPREEAISHAKNLRNHPPNRQVGMKV